MTSLTEIAYYTRKGIIWLGIGLVAFLILRVLFIQLLRIIIPPPAPPKPTVDFGRLPQLIFPSRNKNLSLTYRLETKEGSLPEATISAKVYPIARPSANFLSSQRAKEFAAKLGFLGEPKELTNTMLQFNDSDEARVLLIDTVTANFTLLYDFASHPEVFNLTLSDEQQAKDGLKEYLNNLRILPTSIDTNLTRTQLLRLEGKTLIATSSLSSTQAIRVDFFNQAIEDIPVVTQDFLYSPIYAISTGQLNEKKRFIEVGYHVYPMKLTSFGTYPVKTPQLAWEELQKGQGYIASTPKGLTEIIIRKVYIAYYQFSDYQPYVQPIYVFEGDDNFAAYVPAITADWTESQE